MHTTPGGQGICTSYMTSCEQLCVTYHPLFKVSCLFSTLPGLEVFIVLFSCIVALSLSFALHWLLPGKKSFGEDMS